MAGELVLREAGQLSSYSWPLVAAWQAAYSNLVYFIFFLILGVAGLALVCSTSATSAPQAQRRLLVARCWHRLAARLVRILRQRRQWASLGHLLRQPEVQALVSPQKGVRQRTGGPFTSAGDFGALQGSWR